MPRYIVSSPNPRAGLSNRIKGLISCIRICAQRDNNKLVLNWSKSTNFNCDFNDLFENKFLPDWNDGSDSLDQVHANTSQRVINTWRLIASQDELSDDPAIQTLQPDAIDFQYEAIPLQIRQDYIPCFDQLIAQQTIREEVNVFSKKFDQNTISIALRTWEDCESRQHLFRLENVFSILDRNPNSQFFISCDSSTVLNQIRNNYGERMLVYPARTTRGDRNSKEGIQDALIELLLLSKNSRLKASKLSTFSEVAWWFGGCNAEVEII